MKAFETLCFYLARQGSWLEMASGKCWSGVLHGIDWVRREIVAKREGDRLRAARLTLDGMHVTTRGPSETS